MARHVSGAAQKPKPAAIGETGLQRGLHLLEREPECLGVEGITADVNKQ